MEWCTHGAQPTISILSDDPRLGLFIGCGLIILVLIAAAVGIIARSRWHAAHYYTHESERPENPVHQQSVPPPGEIEGNNGNNGEGFDNLYYNNGNYKNNKWNRMIATIDEINAYVDTPYPELENSLHHHHITDTDTNIMLPPPSSYR